MGILSLYGALLLWELIFLQPTTSSNLKNVKLSLEQDLFRFPANFLFGTASSSYQFEGAYLTDGKGLNNWDIHTHKPGNIIDKSNGDIAVDQYHYYKEDIDLMSSLGVNSYRFSISWARVLPKGRFGDVNQAGIRYYNNLIDDLLRKGIQPFVTLTHFDTPQELEERYGSWLSHESQEDFGYYADICFQYFGDRVKYWATFNEPNYQIILGYRSGEFPPSRCSSPFGNCSDGNSEEEPFKAAHNVILSHATAVDIYRTKYQKEQGGSIGIVLHCAWFVPASNSKEDNLAKERALAFFMNWFLDPVLLGDYPAEMREILGPALPEFTSMDKEKLNQGSDFIGVNHYTSYYIKDCLSSSCEPGFGTSKTEGFYQRSQQNDGIPIGKKTRLDWQQVYPQGMEKIVEYVKERYNNTPMIISENGYGEPNAPALKTEEFLNDTERVEYMVAYLDSLKTAIKKGADVRGYFAWSLLDNFEWTYGYTVRFGLHHIDYSTLERTPKVSATWFKDFIARNSNPDPRYNNM